MNQVVKATLCAALALFAASGAEANDNPASDVQAAKLLICGTAEKAQLYAAQHENIEAAMADETANAASAPCLVAGIAYISGRQMDRVSNNDSAYVVTEITIVGVETPYGMLEVEPSVVYTLLKVKAEAA